jgi:hypothetical protein
MSGFLRGWIVDDSHEVNHQKRVFAKARPEPDFISRSKAAA